MSLDMDVGGVKIPEVCLQAGTLKRGFHALQTQKWKERSQLTILTSRHLAPPTSEPH